MANTNVNKGRKPATTTKAKPVVEKKVEIEEIIEDEVIEEIEAVEEEEIVQPKKVEKYKFENDELIPCKSIFSGKLLMKGIRTGTLYKWVAFGDVIEIEYQDLLALVRANSDYVKKPYLIVENDEFISQYPVLKEVYEAMYSYSDLRDILGMEISAMVKAIDALPEGAKEAIRDIASKQISNGLMDSVKKIRALDEIFETDMVKMTNLFK